MAESLQGGLPGKVGASEAARRSRGPSPGKLPSSTPPDQQTKLLARLRTAEETLRAIQSGEVDALMVSGRRGEQVVSLKGGEPAYRMLVEAMSEGAATLSRNGAVLYCNRRFAELIRRPPGKIIGIAAQSLVAETERDRFETLLAEAQKAVSKGEFNLSCTDGSLVPVYLSLNRFRGFDGQALGMVITDLSEQKRKQATEIKQAEAMHRLLLEHELSAQEEERRRIARELHDEAGQLLDLSSGRAAYPGRRSKASRCQGTRTTATRNHCPGHRRSRTACPRASPNGAGRPWPGCCPQPIRYRVHKDPQHSCGSPTNELDLSTLPSAVQIGLYRILQEALTNVARHSGAKAVSIRFARLATALEVAVIDNGCGFDAKAVAVSSHRLGIQSMRERAAMLGGTLSFTSQGKGTKILVQVPLANQEAQPLVRRRST